MAGQEDLIKEALTDFLKRHSADESINGIDDIVLSYMVGILEELGTDDMTEDTFDIDSFVEMMDAYLPGFSNVNSLMVCEWMFELAARLRELNSPKSPKSLFSQLLPPSIAPPADKPESIPNKSTAMVSKQTSKTHKDGKSGRRSRKSSDKSETEQGAEACSFENMNGHQENSDSDSVKLLMEMFPTACSLEVTHCLDVSCGDLEAAAQLILVRQEAGQSYTSSASKPHRTSAKKMELSDKEGSKLKKSIINKYSYVDMDESKKEHRPVMPKYDEKKLTRYLDNKVVSTKGERFTEVKSMDQEAVKKTTVNLKPAKQYRFH